MSENSNNTQLAIDEQAASYVITWLRNRIIRHPEGDPKGVEPFGFDLYRDLLREKLHLEPIDPTDSKVINEKLPILNAIWDLCVRGILRPGAVTYSLDRSIPIGNHYALTNYGLKWLKETNLNEAVPIEYGRYSKLLTHHDILFGEAYRFRAQEAVRCYEAHAYFACCAMCGAAAESILLALAIKKIGEDEALRDYQQSGGRYRIRNRLISQTKIDIQTRFDSFLGLLNYWRDESAHGIARSIGEEESFTSLLLLLRFAQLGNDEWNTITTNN
jgi:hypothetical protein